MPYRVHARTPVTWCDVSLGCSSCASQHEKMVRACKFPDCNNKMKSYMHCSFHRLPLRVNGEILKLWLAALQIDPNTSITELRKADYRVCSDHFHRDDYYHAQDSSKTPKAYFLKPTAVPRVVNPEEGAQVRLYYALFSSRTGQKLSWSNVSC